MPSVTGKQKINFPLISLLSHLFRAVIKFEFWVMFLIWFRDRWNHGAIGVIIYLICNTDVCRVLLCLPTFFALKVDERAVLRHFDWPEKKADTLREAAFAFRDFKKLEYEVSNYQDDPKLPCDIALKRMVNLSEK